MARQSQQSEKKGKPTWKPASTLDVINKDKKFRYRWADRDPGNIERKLSEGWVFVNKETGIPGEHEHPDRIADGLPVDTTKTYRELVVMALPEERAQARDEYFRERTQNQTIGLKEDLKEKASGTLDRGHQAKIEGSIVID